MNGAERMVATLVESGVECVFGLPGSQNVPIYEALRRSGLRSVVASDETAAAFMACGYARASGRMGVLTTIPGPGFVYALAGVAEAHHDSVPLLWIALRTRESGRAFQLQRIDQAAMARPVVKECLSVERARDLAGTLQEAMLTAISGEPGPVLIEMAADIHEWEEVAASARPAPPTAVPCDADGLRAVMRAADRPLIYAGQGAQQASGLVRQLAAAWQSPVLVTASGRGVLPDTDPLMFLRDFSFDVGNVIPELIARADLILALGCKFTHNGSGGGRLDLPEAKLVRVDSSAAVLAANYPARMSICARVEDVVSVLLEQAPPRSRWSAAELDSLRRRLVAEVEPPVLHEPIIESDGGRPVRDFFRALDATIGPRAVFTTDAGLHQALTRRYARVSRPRSLLCPSDFQSMGFGLSAGIGAAIARPEACVVACIGDGGLALSLGELLTAQREGVDLVVVVFADGYLNLIRHQQVYAFGHASGVEVHRPDYALLAQAVGCSYFRAGADLLSMASLVARTPGVRVVELPLGDTGSFRRQQAVSVVREAVRPWVPGGVLRAVKKALGR